MKRFETLQICVDIFPPDGEDLIGQMNRTIAPNQKVLSIFQSDTISYKTYQIIIENTPTPVTVY